MTRTKKDIHVLYLGEDRYSPRTSQRNQAKPSIPSRASRQSSPITSKGTRAFPARSRSFVSVLIDIQGLRARRSVAKTRAKDRLILEGQSASERSQHRLEPATNASRTCYEGRIVRRTRVRASPKSKRNRGRHRTFDRDPRRLAARQRPQTRIRPTPSPAPTNAVRSRYRARGSASGRRPVRSPKTYPSTRAFTVRPLY